ncbi:Scr1 family TA system antitoxin-like transcriptional regulator [Dactylosporangium sp. NPDC048998]|uniref:helix-turn-helix domain-containing protein n=1 Tax=Dactylosporangium sp. NPDC048998 TaxID=3363976 RepID=UPI003716E93A
MSSGDTPAVARRRVRLAIKDARTAKGFTQGQVADAMEWSLSKVMRIESGEVTISQNDLRPLLAHLGIKDRKVVEDLVQAAKASKQRRQWWDDKRYQGLLTPAMRQLISFEAEASAIRSFALAVVPGWMQTEAYARAIMQPFTYELTEDVISARAAIRTARREMIRAREPRPQIFAVLDESVLLRGFGGPETSHEQFTAIGALIDEGWVHIRIHPMANPFSPFGHYDLLYLSPEQNSHAVLYRESGTSDDIVDDEVRIHRHREGWDQMWESSMGEEESARRIAAAAELPATADDADTRSADQGSSG